VPAHRATFPRGLSLGIYPSQTFLKGLSLDILQSLTFQTGLSLDIHTGLTYSEGLSLAIQPYLTFPKGLSLDSHLSLISPKGLSLDSHLSLTFPKGLSLDIQPYLTFPTGLSLDSHLSLISPKGLSLDIQPYLTFPKGLSLAIQFGLSAPRGLSLLKRFTQTSTGNRQSITRDDPTHGTGGRHLSGSTLHPETKLISRAITAWTESPLPALTHTSYDDALEPRPFLIRGVAVSRPRLFIIDAFAHVFRAYYAIRNIDNNAIFGFTTMLKKLIADENPEYIVVAFDSPGDTFRKEMYPEYKANRDAMPEDLAPQIPVIKELIDAFNIQRIEMTGFEADDLIGTLAKKAKAEGMQAVIVSGDKDMLQLLDGDDIVLYDGKKDIRYLGESGVPDLFGCKREQVIDLLTIWGDSADNIPGVPGVGEKGAKKLLDQYGSLKGIYDHLDEIKRKSYREGFASIEDKIELFRDLVTIRTDLEVPFEPDDFKNRGANGEKIRELFMRLDFKTLLKDMPVELKTLEKDYRLLDTPERLEEMIATIREKGRFVFDVETTSLDPIEAELVGMALATDSDTVGYVPLRHTACEATWTEKAEALLKPIMADAALAKTAHNAKYDISVLTARGWKLDGTFDDTMLMSYLISPTDSRHGLDELAETMLDYRTIHYEEICTEDQSFASVDPVKACRYAGEDADICHQLYETLSKSLDEAALREVYEKVERPLIPVLARMELAGVGIDPDYLAKMSTSMAETIAGLEEKTYELAGERFNIKSTKQLGHILFEKLELPALKKTSKTGSYSTDQQVLERLAAKGHELPAKLLEYREVTKLKSTYVDALPKMINPATDRVHSSFNQFVTATGRLSSNNPNLQNIPIRKELGRDIRAAFVPEEGHVFVAADYSQIELRLMAHFSGDKTLTAGFRAGEDIHTRTASEIMGVMPETVTSEMRAAAKSINFGLIYGMGEFRLAQELGITRKQAKKYIETYFEKMPNVLTFRDSVIEKAREAGEVRTFMGRLRKLPELNSRNKNMQAQGERLAVNTKIQGSAAEIIKLAMIALDAALTERFPQARLLLQVHDELVLECPEGDAEAVAELLRETMEGVVAFNVPLTAEASTGKNWKEAK